MSVGVGARGEDGLQGRVGRGEFFRNGKEIWLFGGLARGFVDEPVRARGEEIRGCPRVTIPAVRAARGR